MEITQYTDINTPIDQAIREIKGLLQDAKIVSDPHDLIGRTCLFNGSNEKFYSIITGISCDTTDGILMIEVAKKKYFSKPFRFIGYINGKWSLYRPIPKKFDLEKFPHWHDGDFVIFPK